MKGVVLVVHYMVSANRICEVDWRGVGIVDPTYRCRHPPHYIHTRNFLPPSTHVSQVSMESLQP